ncbi:MAG TPA: hypothetical protein VFM98_02645 [Ramlibacter sp.]|uniref:hypothetical protein n=1 Tax=Ramlibacter sp. TaxID=1917967 RepID=UPI002D7F6F6F|nr:hypothetical protein [Ramlibacter sp.]HET8744475.1 hypothetical protein [Ramlibacter sp.]
MKTAAPAPAPPTTTQARLTLVDWMDAHRALMEEEERLKTLAGHRLRPDGLEALERQRMRVQVAQDAADAIYDAVMQDLRTS